MRELTEKTDRGRTFYRLLSFLPTSYREPFSFFFFFFLQRTTSSRFDKRDFTRSMQISFSSILASLLLTTRKLGRRSKAEHSRNRFGKL